MHWTVRGRGLKRNIVENAVRLSHEKYCSATAMLVKTAEVTRDFELVEA
jgi:putative redox protein